MSGGPISAQWSLDQTADSFLKVAVGLVKAASSDNVQVLALISAEQFGATLPMCEDTCNEIHELATRNQTFTVQFLLSQIGWYKGDSAHQLSRSDAGVRFLSLSAALLNTMTPFKGASLLHKLIMDGARDRTVAPAAAHVKQLLEALEGRLSRSSFANDILDWTLNVQNAAAQDLAEFGHVVSDPSLGSAPDEEGIAGLIDAFRQLGRIGTGTAIRICLTWPMVSCVPWIIAFTKWCMGVLPLVGVEGGPWIIDEEMANGSNITILISRPGEGEQHVMLSSMQVQVMEEIDKPAELISESSGTARWAGMVTIERFGSRRLQAFEAKMQSSGISASDLPRRALMQALPYAIRRVSTCLALPRHELFTPLSSEHYDYGQQYWPTLLPLDYEIELAAQKYTGAPNIALRRLENDMLIRDLPLVKLCLQDLGDACTCPSCKRGEPNHGKECFKFQFFLDLGSIVADILAISLCRSADPLYVYHQTGRSQIEGRALSEAIADEFGLQTGTHADWLPISWKALLLWTLNLVGHDVSEDIKEDRWILSTAKGQALYPLIFETLEMPRAGYLCLECIPGILQHKNIPYKRVRCITPHGWLRVPKMVFADEVTHAAQLFPQGTLKWAVVPQDQYLEVEMIFRSNMIQSSIAPWSCIDSLSRSLFVQKCPHPRDQPLQEVDRQCVYANPYCYKWPSDSQNPRSTEILVSPVEGSNGLRLMSLGQPLYSVGEERLHKHVVRFDACLQCCLDVCRRMNYNVVVC